MVAHDRSKEGRAMIIIHHNLKPIVFVNNKNIDFYNKLNSHNASDSILHFIRSLFAEEPEHQTVWTLMGLSSMGKNY